MSTQAVFGTIPKVGDTYTYCENGGENLGVVEAVARGKYFYYGRVKVKDYVGRAVIVTAPELDEASARRLSNAGESLASYLNGEQISALHFFVSSNFYHLSFEEQVAYLEDAIERRSFGGGRE